MRKIILAIIPLVFVAVFAFAARPAEALDPPVMPDEAEIEELSRAKVIIETKFGEIVLKLFPRVAPMHVKNFVQLARSGYYNATTFHRVIPGFMIQGGDPKTKSQRRAGHGTGGPGYTIRAEFSDSPHKRGTLSMARMAQPDTAGSQFFICVADVSWLDGKYTVFGEVVSGMDVVDQIVKQPRDRRDNPLERVTINVIVVTEDAEKGEEVAPRKQ